MAAAITLGTKQIFDAQWNVIHWGIPGCNARIACCSRDRQIRCFMHIGAQRICRINGIQTALRQFGRE